MAEGTSSPIRVMWVEDNAAVRSAVAALLNASGNMHVCAESATVAQAGPLAETSHPDVVIVDMRLPDGSGVEAIREVRAALPDARVLLLTSASKEEAILAAVLAGASGFLVKQLLGNDLVGTVRALAGGDTLIDLTDGAAAVERARDRLAASDGEASCIVGLRPAGEPTGRLPWTRAPECRGSRVGGVGFGPPRGHSPASAGGHRRFAGTRSHVG